MIDSHNDWASMPGSVFPVFGSDSLQIELQVSQESETPRRSHDSFEIITPATSDVQIDWWSASTGNQTIQLRREEVIVIPPHEEHQARWRDPAGLLFATLENAIIDNACSYRGLGRADKLTCLLCASEPAVTALIRSTMEKNASLLEGSRQYADSLGCVIGHRLLLQFDHQFEAKTTSDDHIPINRIAIMIEYVESNFKRDITLSELAALAGISKHGVIRLFKKAVDKSPHQYIVERKIREAKKLLAGSTLSVAEIARQLGFAHSSHFAASFQRLNNVAPGHYRARQGLGPFGSEREDKPSAVD